MQEMSTCINCGGAICTCNNRIEANKGPYISSGAPAMYVIDQKMLLKLNDVLDKLTELTTYLRNKK